VAQLVLVVVGVVQAGQPTQMVEAETTVGV